MTTGEKAPRLVLEGVFGEKKISFDLASRKGAWTVVVFYPADFSFVCPTEVTGFSKRAAEFEALKTQVVAVSVDPVATHDAWAKELGGVAIPLLSDPAGAAIRAWGAGDPGDAPRALRATFIVDPVLDVAWMTASPRNVGRSVEETLRVLKALQTGRAGPADWKPGDPSGEPLP
jgi:peroxiredoxin (alkyl hydroperoxide reductase subunit C)